MSALKRPVKKWQVLDSQIVFDASPYVRIRCDVCALPHGVTVDDYYVLEGPNVVMVVAITEDNEILLVEQYKHAYGDLIIELPAGVMDGDNPEEEARRELLEETGYEANTLTHLLKLVHSPTRSTTQVHVYLAQGVKRVKEQQLDDNEAIQVIKVPINRIEQMILQEKIIASDSVAGLYAMLRQLGL